MTVRPHDHYQGAKKRTEHAAITDWFHGGPPGEWRICRLRPSRVYRTRAD
jgi:hypothetical protein